MQRTFRGIHVDGEYLTYRGVDHPLLGARASVKTPAALRRDVSAGRLMLDEATAEQTQSRRSAAGLFLVVTAEDYTLAVPVPTRKGSDARTFSSRLNTAANRLALANPETPASEVSTMAERYSAGSQVPPPKFASGVSTIPETSELPTTTPSAPRGSSEGWYPDPTRRYTHRYWDGNSWTEHVARNGMRTRDQMPRRSNSGQAGSVRRTSGSPGGIESVTEAIASMFGVPDGR